MSNENGQGIAEQLTVLPAQLERRLDDLVAALSASKDPSEWPDGESFVRAYAPENIAQILIPQFHPMLKTRPIAYLWRETMQGRGKIVLGKASLAGGKLRHFAKVDFVIEFNFTAWQELTPRQRVALVDHELMHCATDGDSQKAIMISHDVEEFGSIIYRWGLWTPNLSEFGQRVREAPQLGLFEPAAS